MVNVSNMVVDVGYMVEVGGTFWPLELKLRA